MGSLQEALIVLLNRPSFLLLLSCLAINSLHSIIEKLHHQRIGRSPYCITDFLSPQIQALALGEVCKPYT